MGSSSSIMQATLNAGGDVQNSTITFHCQELREAGETEIIAAPPSSLNLSSPDSGVTSMTSSGDNMTSPPNLPNKTLSPQDEQAAVTRYFPIIQPQISSFIPRIEIIEHNMLPNFLDAKSGDSKDRHTKENYYYSCDICSKGFMFKGSLNRHLARHVQNGRDGDEVRTTPRQFPITNKGGIGTSEVRYQLKDPRLYEQQGKLQIQQQEKRISKSASTTHGTKSYSTANRKARDKCSLCGTAGHTPSNCKTFPRNLVLGQKVLAICSCLKCNRSFDDVDKLKDHISKCQGFDRPKQIVQSECNVR